MLAIVPKWLVEGVVQILIYFAPLVPSVKFPNLDKPRSQTMSLARMMEMISISHQKDAVILLKISLFQARNASAMYLRSYVMTVSHAASP
jgi:hypothetical protein